MIGGDGYERLAYHLDSLIALVLFVYASMVALMINHRRPEVRARGLWLGAAGCLALTAGIVGLAFAGQFAEMRPPRFSIDPYKPVVMWIMAAIFLVAGVALAHAARGQRNLGSELDIGRDNDPERYGRVSRYLHWTIAILFLLLIPMGVFSTMLPYDVAYRHAFYVIHKTVGLTVLLLAAIRVGWLLYSPPPPHPDLSGFERSAARVAHLALYFFLLAFPLSGFVLGTSLGKLTHFYIWDLPLFWGEHEASLAWARWAHKIILPFTFYLVFVGHLLGAFKHRFLAGHENAAKRMVT